MGATFTYTNVHIDKEFIHTYIIKHGGCAIIFSCLFIFSQSGNTTTKRIQLSGPHSLMLIVTVFTHQQSNNNNNNNFLFVYKTVFQ